MIYVMLWLDTRRAKKDGTFPLKLYVKYDNGKLLVSLPFSASEVNWEKNEYGRKEVAFKAKNAYVAKAEEALLALERAGKLARASMKCVKRSIRSEQIALLRSYECEPYQRRYRDVFMLMFNLIGINAKDLFMTRPSAFVDGRIEYRRAKTGKFYSVKWSRRPWR